jgi:hypothetical protein
MAVRAGHRIRGGTCVSKTVKIFAGAGAPLRFQKWNPRNRKWNPRNRKWNPRSQKRDLRSRK